jgi:hypothetical protein
VLHARIKIGMTVLMHANIPHADRIEALISLSGSRVKRTRSARIPCVRTAATFHEDGEEPFANRFAMYS